MKDLPIYLDFNATTPIDPAVAETMLPCLTEVFGNPSSSHAYGARARRAVESARAQVASLIGARPEEVIFTSGGSESNNMVIQGVAASLRWRGRHIITSAVEHPAVLEPCAALEAQGFRITILPVDGRGRVDPGDVEKAITTETILITIMHANNEVGTIQPIAEIAEIARARSVLLHTDAAQSAGKIAVDVDALGVDFLSIAGHKLYAPKGIGALYIRTGRELPRLIHGADHEGGRRAGTENVLEIVGLGRAAEIARERLDATAEHCRRMRDRLWDGLSGRVAGIRRNGDPEASLPNTLSVSFRGVDASALLAEIGDQVAASAGAACHAEDVDVSSVLEAMKVPLDYAMGTVRFSTGRTTTEAEIDLAIEVVAEAVARLQAPQAAAAPADVQQGEEIRLTRFTHGMGCACKLRPQELEVVLRSLPRPASADVLVDASTADDAAAYRLSGELAIVQTVDFFTPIADDPFDFGAISAANSLSDIYAMGARPLFALSIVGFPSRRLPLSVLARILEGAAAKAREAGIDIVGGHSVEDTEPKFGLAVTGAVHPRRILTNRGAQPGDALILTKPVGTGIIMTAAKLQLASGGVVESALETMRSLNRAAAEALAPFDVHALTDVTGFGLLGHLREMTVASGVNAELRSSDVPLLSGALDFATAGGASGGTVDNLAHVSPHVDWTSTVARGLRLLLADAQTSGGLLIAVAPGDAEPLLGALLAAGVASARRIGAIAEKGAGRIRVLE